MDIINKEAVFNRVEELKDEIIEFEREMIKIPSRNPPGEYNRISRFLADKLKEVGFTVKIVGPKPEKPNVIGTLRGTVGKPTLVLSSHMDTVPEGPGWTVDPFEAVVKEGKIFGRGAYDPHARTCTYTMAVKAIKDEGIKLKGNVVDAITVDEETGGVDGAGWCSKEGHIRGDMLIGEGPGNTISVCEYGYMNLEVSTLGKAMHARAPYLGINAINKMAKFILGLEKFQEKLKEKKATMPVKTMAGKPPIHAYTTLNVGTISGGTKVNVTAPKCTIEVDCRIIPDMQREEVRSGVDEIIEELQKEDPQFKVEIKELFSAPSSKTSPKIPLVSTIRNVVKEVASFTPDVVAIPATSDRTHFRLLAGIPSVGWGVGSSPENRPHAADEYIAIDDLVTFTKATALVIMNLLG